MMNSPTRTLGGYSYSSVKTQSTDKEARCDDDKNLYEADNTAFVSQTNN